MRSLMVRVRVVPTKKLRMRDKRSSMMKLISGGM
jgi:hypothetical protein